MKYQSVRCPLCGENMGKYEQGVFDTKEYGFCCSECEIGIFAYRKEQGLSIFDYNFPENVRNLSVS